MSDCITGSSSMTFTAALHTYFGVSDIHKASVTGLKGERIWAILGANRSAVHLIKVFQKENSLDVAPILCMLTSVSLIAHCAHSIQPSLQVSLS